MNYILFYNNGYYIALHSSWFPVRLSHRITYTFPHLSENFQFLPDRPYSCMWRGQKQGEIFRNIREYEKIMFFQLKDSSQKNRNFPNRPEFPSWTVGKPNTKPEIKSYNNEIN